MGTKISQFTDGVTANSTDKIAAVRGASDIYITPAYIAAFVPYGLIARANLGASFSWLANVSAKLDFPNVEYDPLGTITGSGGSWKFTVPATGNYDFSLTNLIYSGPWTQGDEFKLYCYINNVFYGWLGYDTIQSTFTGGYRDFNRMIALALTAADFVSFDLETVSGDSRTFYGGVLSINRIH